MANAPHWPVGWGALGPSQFPSKLSPSLTVAVTLRLGPLCHAVGGPVPPPHDDVTRFVDAHLSACTLLGSTPAWDVQRTICHLLIIHSFCGMPLCVLHALGVCIFSFAQFSVFCAVFFARHVYLNANNSCPSLCLLLVGCINYSTDKQKETK